MMNPNRTFLTLILLVYPAAPILGQSPDPIEILKKADAATRAVKVCTYDAEFHGEGDLASRIPQITGAFSCREVRSGFFLKVLDQDKPEEPSLRARLAISMKTFGSDKTRHLDISLDGKTVTFIDLDDKYWMQQKLPMAGPLLESAQPLYMIEFLHPTPFSDEINGREQTYEGEKEINGVPCDVIFVKYQQKGLLARWYFGREDSLPRRVERVFHREKGEFTRVLTLSNLNIMPEVTSNEFLPPCPAGFERRALVEPVREGASTINRPAPDWELKTPDGKVVALKDFRGKVVVLNFWATWCGFCKMSMPAVQAVTEKYADKPVKVLGVCCWDPQGDPAQYLASMEYTFDTVIGGDKIAEDYGVKGLPTFFVIDADGKIVYAGAGAPQQVNLAGAIDKALGEGKK